MNKCTQKEEQILMNGIEANDSDNGYIWLPASLFAYLHGK